HARTRLHHPDRDHEGSAWRTGRVCLRRGNALDLLRARALGQLPSLPREAQLLPGGSAPRLLAIGRRSLLLAENVPEDQPGFFKVELLARLDGLHPAAATKTPARQALVASDPQVHGFQLCPCRGDGPRRRLPGLTPHGAIPETVIPHSERDGLRPPVASCERAA